jgi:hypothetical protein
MFRFVPGLAEVGGRRPGQLAAGSNWLHRPHLPIWMASAREALLPQLSILLDTLHQAAPLACVPCRRNTLSPIFSPASVPTTSSRAGSRVQRSNATSQQPRRDGYGIVDIDLPRSPPSTSKSAYLMQQLVVRYRHRKSYRPREFRHERKAPRLKSKIVQLSSHLTRDRVRCTASNVEIAGVVAIPQYKLRTEVVSPLCQVLEESSIKMQL